MQVSFHGEVEDHVIIGGGKAEPCSIDDTAEFLDMLSDTIYREKALAAVREPMCNAWDAHIAAGKTDIPLVVTIGDGKLTIQDFGAGIAPEKMHGIYCVYGRSTKRTDETQTGGFGIGSKAPWAYSKHFTVASSYNGTRTVYAMSKGSTENEGKPDMRPITAVSCDQSGLTVTIPIKDGDQQNFHTLVRNVAIGGGIRVMLNGELLPYREYDAGRKLGFVLVEASDNFTGGKVAILVGTVLYPLTTEDPDIREKLKRLGNLVPNGYRVVLLAEPNTISIAPSRESLSYGDRTIQAVNGLLDRSLTIMSRLKADPQMAKMIIQRGLNISPLSLSFKMPSIGDVLPKDAWKKNVLADQKSIATALSCIYVDENTGHSYIRGNLKKYAFDHLMRVDRSRRSFWKREAIKSKDQFRLDLAYYSRMLFRHMLRKIGQKAAKMGMFENLSILNRSTLKKHDLRNPVSKSGDRFEAFLCDRGDQPSFIMGCRAGVIRDNILDTFSIYGRREVIPVLQIPKERKDEARLFAKFMRSMGFKVIDLIDVEPERKPRVAKSEPKKKAPLFFGLSDLATTPTPYDGTPKHFIHIGQRQGDMKPQWAQTYRLCREIAEVVPDTCIIFTAEALKEAEQLGMTPAADIALAKIEKAIKCDTPAVFEFLRQSKGVVIQDRGWRHDEVIRGINTLIHDHPSAFSVISGKRSAHNTSEADQGLGSLMATIVSIFGGSCRYEARFYGRDNNGKIESNLKDLALNLSNRASQSRYSISGKKLLEQYPAFSLVRFHSSDSTNITTSLSEKSIATIIRSFMKA